MTDPVIASFPLSRGRSGNWAYLRFTRPLTAAEWDLFSNVLGVMKDGIVEQPDDETEPTVEFILDQHRVAEGPAA